MRSYLGICLFNLPFEHFKTFDSSIEQHVCFWLWPNYAYITTMDFTASAVRSKRLLKHNSTHENMTFAPYDNENLALISYICHQQHEMTRQELLLTFCRVSWIRGSNSEFHQIILELQFVWIWSRDEREEAQKVITKRNFVNSWG